MTARRITESNQKARLQDQDADGGFIHQPVPAIGPEGPVDVWVGIDAHHAEAIANNDPDETGVHNFEIEELFGFDVQAELRELGYGLNTYDLTATVVVKYEMRVEGIKARSEGEAEALVDDHWEDGLYGVDRINVDWDGPQAGVEMEISHEYSDLEHDYCEAR